MKYWTFLILPFRLLSVATSPGMADEAELDYKAAMRCGAILSIQAAEDEENDSELAQEHESEVMAWFGLTFISYEGDEEQLDAEVETTVERVISRYEALTDDVDRSDFLIEELAQCSELRAFHAQAFDEFHSMVDETEEGEAAEAAVDAVE